MSPPRALTYDEYVERLRRLLNSRRPGGIVLQDAPRAQQIAITAWLTTLQRFRAYQVYSQLGSWERQEHFFAVVSRVSLARVPLELPTPDELFHLAATTFDLQQQALHHASALADGHAAGRAQAAYEPSAREVSSAVATRRPSVFQRRSPLAPPPTLGLPSGPLGDNEHITLTMLAPVARHSMYVPKRYDTMEPPREPWDHNAAWLDAHLQHSPLADGSHAPEEEEDTFFRDAWHDGLGRRS